MLAGITSMIAGLGTVAAVNALAVEIGLIAVACLGIYGGVWAVKKIKHALV
jgi:hypothetical protein